MFCYFFSSEVDFLGAGTGAGLGCGFAVFFLGDGLVSLVGGLHLGQGLFPFPHACHSSTAVADFPTYWQVAL